MQMDLLTKPKLNVTAIVMYPIKEQIERVFSREGKGQNNRIAITLDMVQAMTRIGKTSRLGNVLALYTLFRRK